MSSETMHEEREEALGHFEGKPQTLPKRIATLYLAAAADVPAADFHERWKPVHYAAGIIVGAALTAVDLAATLTGPAQHPSVHDLAWNLADQAIAALYTLPHPFALDADRQKVLGTIAAGLRNRVGEQLAKLGEA